MVFDQMVRVIIDRNEVDIAFFAIEQQVSGSLIDDFELF
jgi:hypothetical protein